MINKDELLLTKLSIVNPKAKDNLVLLRLKNGASLELTLIIF